MHRNLSLLSLNDTFNLSLVSGLTQCEKGNYLDFALDKPQGMSGYMLQLTTFGQGCIFDGEQTFDVQKGQLLLFFPKAIQHYYRHPDAQSWHYKWIYFMPSPTMNKWLSWSNKEANIGRIKIHDSRYFQEMSQLFSKVDVELKSNYFFKEDVATTLLEYLLMKCISAEKIAIIPAIDHRILTACDVILSNLAANDSVESIAEKVFLSPSRLSHLFKKSLGVSLVQWRELQRISESKKLLYFSNISILNIAKSLGYEDSLYFSKIFKKHTGLSPSEFRTVERGKEHKV
ncbi:AraC family transcriptional regulator [Nicoletella semolina]|uniref:AraC family transcriptional regulator n=1 Tax=Nicoletella semolina TaxID=271160 RepID=A0A4R2N8X4_9PAST|nr:arabinose operon transcriptional regulator AraC [Nicoletella semolina]MDH2924527.1 DNA-binding transcriptional regulator AraC [Nicoletella semolina]TCP17345.1 AraC family transcriptional regulator [Nicoletella semolina]